MRRDQPNRADSVIVAGNRVIDLHRVAVRIHQRHDGHSDPLGLAHRDGLLAHVHHEERAGHLRHLLDPAEVAVQPRYLVVQLQRFLLRQREQLALRLALLKLHEVVDPLLNRREVRQRPAQPARVDVVRAAPLGLAHDRVLRLLLRSDEDDLLPLRRHVLHELRRPLQELQRLLKIDDVDAVAVREDILAHLRIPPPLLMPEVDARLQQRLHRNRRPRLSLYRFFQLLDHVLSLLSAPLPSAPAQVYHIPNFSGNIHPKSPLSHVRALLRRGNPRRLPSPSRRPPIYPLSRRGRGLG